jgi:hypothetical protein
VLLDATAGSDAGIDVVSSEYATVAAEQTALERLSKVVADQIVAARPVTRRGAARRGEGEQGQHRARARPARPDTSASILFYGPDEGRSRALAKRLQGAGRERRRRLSGAAEVRSGAPRRRSRRHEPVRRARATSGRAGRRRSSPRGRGAASAPAAESPVIAIAGALKPDLALLKLAESSPGALATLLRRPKGGDAERMVIDVGRTFGLRIRGRRRRADRRRLRQRPGDRRQELEKLALYVDASPERPKELDHDALDAVGAACEEGDFPRWPTAARRRPAALATSSRRLERRASRRSR